VFKKGDSKKMSDTTNKPTYEQLEEENRRLKNEIEYLNFEVQRLKKNFLSPSRW